MPDPDFYPGENVGSEIADDRLKAVMAPCTAAFSEPDLCRRQIHVVTDNQNPFAGNRILPANASHCPSRKVHKRIGLDQHRTITFSNPRL